MAAAESGKIGAAWLIPGAAVMMRPANAIANIVRDIGYLLSGSVGMRICRYGPSLDSVNVLPYSTRVIASDLRLFRAIS